MAEDSLHIMLSEVLKYDKKGDYRNEINGNPGEFLIAARKADYIVLCLGENSYTETPGNLNDLALSENQQQLTRLAASTGKPVILLLVQGRPRIISAIEPLAAAILQAYLPGNYGGDAIASILYGDVNPSGRLPFTYPRYQNSLEQYYHAYTEQLDDPSSPNKSAFFPQWEFGSGLSYSTFEYSNLILSSNKYRAADTLKGSVKVMNLSDRPGMEVIQLYCSDLVASITPPVKRLRWFTKIMLQPGESQTVAFEIPVSSLAFVNNDNAWVVEQGDFTLSTNNLRAEFKVLNTRVIATP
jgi:beta-glucosidase